MTLSTYFCYMTQARTIRERIDQIAVGKTFGYQELQLDKWEYLKAAKALERLQKTGVIKRLSKGIFYKPEQTVFGALLPEYDELLRPFLFENGKRVGYITGTSLYNRLGLTTQVPIRIKIAKRGNRLTVNRGPLKAEIIKSYGEINDYNYEVLGLLDAFKDIQQIPDCSVNLGLLRLNALVQSLDKDKFRTLIESALLYPPRVRALVGAVLENNSCNSDCSALKESLNPLTVYKLRINDIVLPTKSNWNIK